MKRKKTNAADTRARPPRARKGRDPKDGQAIADRSARRGVPEEELQGPPARETMLVRSEEERRQRVRASVEELPDFLRQVLLLAYFQGLKYREVAEILGIPVGTVKSRLHAALVKLQEMWSESPSLYEV